MLTLVVIARDEADRIGRCLRSVPPDTARVVVLDDATRDDTADVCRRESARVVMRRWPGHVHQKNHAMSLALTPWVLALDADEWLSEAALADVLRAIRDPGAAAGFSFPRCSTWLGRPLRHGRWFPDRKLRLVRRDRARWVGDDPHDRLEVDGPIVALTGEIGHEPYRSVWEHLRTIDGYSRIQARRLAERGVRATAADPWIRPTLHLVDSVLLRGAWRDGADGLVVAGLGAVHTHLKYRRLRSAGRRP